MLTAKSGLDNKVTGLDSGADDYLTKPFQTRELLARVRALCRRNIRSQDGSLCFGDLALDTTTATLTCRKTGQSVRLGEKELRIMEYMIANQGQILTREQLAVIIWGLESDAEYNNVEVYGTAKKAHKARRAVIRLPCRCCKWQHNSVVFPASAIRRRQIFIDICQ